MNPRPAPALRLRLDGHALDAALASSLTSLCVTQALSLPTQCEVMFALADAPNVQIAAPGTALEIEVDGELLFRGGVTAVETVLGPARVRQIALRAYDALHQLRKRKSYRVAEQIRLEDLAQELVRDLGLDVRAEVATPLLPHVLQASGDDLEWLRSCAARQGFYMYLHDRILLLLTLQGAGSIHELTLGDALLELSVEQNSVPACSAVSLTGWDIGTGAVIQASALPAGAQAAQSGFALASAELAAPGAREVLALAGLLVGGAADAEAQAQAELQRREADGRVLRACCVGNARLAPGRRVSVRGAGPALDGPFVLTEVTHSFEPDRGFLSELSSAAPELPPPGAAPHLALGQVTRIDDPDHLGRVRVRLASLGAGETDWLQVLSAGAGPSKGLTCVPDLDDWVLVYLPTVQSAQGVVLGGLYGQRGASDPTGDSSISRRLSLRSNSGHLLRLDDEQRTLTLRDATGSGLELTEDQVVLRATTALVIEAPGQSIVIRGKSIDFEQA